MKKFSFSLHTVKGYKEKLLDNIKMEYSAIVNSISRQKEKIAVLEETERLVIKELNEKNSEGITPYELMNYQRYLKALQKEIELEFNKLRKLKTAEAAKKEEMIEAKKETASFEKLEEKKLKEYNSVVRKSQELFIEEFVNNKKYAEKR